MHMPLASMGCCLGTSSWFHIEMLGGAENARADNAGVAKYEQRLAMHLTDARQTKNR